ncbi:MAG: DUF4252 domain-containing protein, partial [Saprospiraceae bacterium]
MKPFLLFYFTVLLASTSLWSQANAIDTYFQDYVEDERFSVVYVSPRVFQLFEKMSSEKMDMDEREATAFRDMASDLRGLRILSTDITPAKFYDEAQRKINTKLYEPLVTIRERNGGKTSFLLRENSQGVIEELLFISYGTEEFTLMSFVGNLNLDKIMKL